MFFGKYSLNYLFAGIHGRLIRSRFAPDLSFIMGNIMNKFNSLGLGSLIEKLLCNSALNNNCLKAKIVNYNLKDGRVPATDLIALNLWHTCVITGGG